MSKYMRYVDPITGQPYLIPVEDDLGGDPGPGVRRAREMLSRLPDAELAGYHGPGIVPHGESPHGGGRKNAPETFRPLGGAPQQARGDGKLVLLDHTGASTTVNTVVETPRGNGDDAESLIVTLGMNTDSIPESILKETGYTVTANVTWGVGGANFDAEIDWLNGTTFVLPANYARVGATVDLTVPPSVDSKLYLFASYAYGKTTGGRIASPVRRTVSVDASINPAVETSAVAVPKFGVSMNLIDTQALATSYLISFYATIGGVNNLVAKYLKTGRSNMDQSSSSAFEVPNGARFFTVKNVGAAVAEGVQASFNLGL